jgi:pimeloyl-ACP methyl ester carboxylesterase
MLTVETRAGLVAYEEQGVGTPLLLLHANTGDHRQFEGIVPTLAYSYRTIALDWPGFGASAAPHPPQAATAMLMADVLEDVVTHLDLEPALLLGHSVGLCGSTPGDQASRACARSSWLIQVVSPLHRASSAGCWPGTGCSPLRHALCAVLPETPHASG